MNSHYKISRNRMKRFSSFCDYFEKCTAVPTLTPVSQRNQRNSLISFHVCCFRFCTTVALEKTISRIFREDATVCDHFVQTAVSLIISIFLQNSGVETSKIQLILRSVFRSTHRLGFNLLLAFPLI